MVKKVLLVTLLDCLLFLLKTYTIFMEQTFVPSEQDPIPASNYHW